MLCNRNPLIQDIILDNILTGEKTECKRNTVPLTHDANTVVRKMLSERQWKTKDSYIQNLTETAEFSQKGGLENLALTGHIEDKMDKL